MDNLSADDSRGAGRFWGAVEVVDDGAYFARRALEERLAANDAPNQNAKRIHLNMAAAYERRARALGAQERSADLKS